MNGNELIELQEQAGRDITAAEAAEMEGLAAEAREDAEREDFLENFYKPDEE